MQRKVKKQGEKGRKIGTEHDIYFNLSIYIQLIVANKT